MSTIDIAIIGGGLAGLTSAIHLRSKGYNVLVVEQHDYPRHKVCGEYISDEVKPYLQSLGVDVVKAGATSISRFQLTNVREKFIETRLPLGGFGISRYTLDKLMADRAIELGVEIIQDKVENVQFTNERFVITLSKSNARLKAKVAIGAYGKRSTLDKQLKRKFMLTRTPWIGVKSHYRGEFDDSLVSLNHFEGGYCGLSCVENQKINACYLIHQSMFQRYGNVQEVQENVLAKNPFMARFYDESEMLFDRPLTISQIYFGRRDLVHEHIIMIGDTGGMIHPLAGNGMAIAIHSAKLASMEVQKYLEGTISRETMESAYQSVRKHHFDRRIKVGSVIQSLFERQHLSHQLMNVAHLTPWILPYIIRQTHGKPIGPLE